MIVLEWHNYEAEDWETNPQEMSFIRGRDCCPDDPQNGWVLSAGRNIDDKTFDEVHEYLFEHEISEVDALEAYLDRITSRRIDDTETDGE